MNKFMDWVTNSFTPKINKIARNVWVSAVQESILAAMPMVFIGSFATLLNIIREYWSAFPDLEVISTFSFGLFSIFLSYLIPESLMNKKQNQDSAKQAGLAGLAFFLILVYPTITENGIIQFDINTFGAGGMIAALLAGLFVAVIMNLATKWKFIGEDSAIPDFVAVWFNTLLPILIILLIGWLFTFQLEINLYSVINTIFSPLIYLGQSFWGFVLVYFLGFAFFYSFGISNWVIYPVQTAIALPAIAQNQSNYSMGAEVTNIFTNEAGSVALIGGGGMTLSLCIMLAFLARSNRLRLIGKASFIPSIFNINEPIVFGAPIAFNPILMIPMWINGFVGPVLTYLVMAIGLVPIPHSPFQLWYIPIGLGGWLFTQSWQGAVYQIILFIISWFIYYPFFKAYDRQATKEDYEMETAEG